MIISDRVEEITEIEEITEVGALASIDYEYDYDYYEDYVSVDELVDTGLLEIECGYCATKFDSAASSNMSGKTSRLKNVDWNISPVMINGFNGSKSKVAASGMNHDGLREYHVPGMPDDLVLLCAQMYVAKHGAAVLFEDDGEVLDLNKQELAEFREYVHTLKSAKRLKVVNRTYEIVNDIESEVSSDVQEAYSSTATRYFNTKVNVSNDEQRVLTMLLTGLSFADLYSMVVNGSVGGLPTDLTKTALNRFAHKYGRTPDIIRMANPINYRSLFGLMEADTIVKVGQRIECDEMHPDCNVTANKKTQKLKTFGGAESALVFVDVYSGFVKGKLMKVGVPFKDEVLYLLKMIRLVDKVQPVVLAADSGIVSQSKYESFHTEIEGILSDLEIKYEKVEPYNHARGGAVVEVSIRLIKQLIRLATMYVLTNPNFSSFGFEKVDIFRMWGELFGWAIIMINLKPSPNNPKITRYEAYYGKKPNVHNIRVLPIFSCVLVIRPAVKHVVDTAKDDSGKEIVFSTNQPRNELALYIGPSLKTVGGIRAVSKTTEGLIQVFVTSKFTATSDGGGVNVHKDVEEGTKRMIDEIDETVKTTEGPTTVEQPVIRVEEPSVDIDLDVTIGQQVVVESQKELETPVVEINDDKTYCKNSA